MGGQQEQEQTRNLLRDGAKTRRENSNCAMTHGELQGDRTARRMNSYVVRREKGESNVARNHSWEKEERRQRQKGKRQNIRKLSLEQEATSSEQAKKDKQQNSRDIRQEIKDEEQRTRELELNVSLLEVKTVLRDLGTLEVGLVRRDLEQEDRAKRHTRREMEVALDTFGRDHYVLFGILALVVVLVWLINNIVENLS